MVVNVSLAELMIIKMNFGLPLKMISCRRYWACYVLVFQSDSFELHTGLASKRVFSGESGSASRVHRVSRVNLTLSFRFYFLRRVCDRFLYQVQNILLTWPYVITCFCVSVCFCGWSAFTDCAFFCPCLTLSLWLGVCSLSIQLYESI